MTQLALPTHLEVLPRTVSAPVAAPAEACSLADSRPARRTVRHYQIGAVAVSLRSDLPAVQAAFHQCYRVYHVDHAGSGTFSIDVVTRRSWRSLRRYYHILGNGEEIFVTRRPEMVLPHVEWAINSLVARHLPSYYQIHASVVSRHGTAVVFPGLPGQGKSTLAAALLRRGWSYLSDEFALIDPDTRLLVPYPKALCIKAGAFNMLEALGLPLDLSYVLLKGTKGRVAMLSPLAVRHDAVCEPCPIGAIMFPEWSPGQQPALEPMPRAQGLFQLIQVSFNFVKFRRGGFDLLAEIVRQVRCYRLRTGDLKQTCELVESGLGHGRLGGNA
jgi:HprK-related kinase A